MYQYLAARFKRTFIKLIDKAIWESGVLRLCSLVWQFQFGTARCRIIRLASSAVDVSSHNV